MENKMIVDIAELFSLAGASFVALIFFLVKKYISEWNDDLKKVQKDILYIKEKLMLSYVRREDFKESISEIKTLIKDLSAHTLK